MLPAWRSQSMLAGSSWPSQSRVDGKKKKSPDFTPFFLLKLVCGEKKDHVIFLKKQKTETVKPKTKQ